MANEAVLWRVYDAAGSQPREIIAFTIRAQNNARFTARLLALIDARLEEITQKTQPIFEEADEQLASALLAYPDLKLTLEECKFDEDKFCPSPEAAEKLKSHTSRGEFPNLTFATPSRRDGE